QRANAGTLVKRPAMNEKLARRKTVMPVPYQDRNKEERRNQKHHIDRRTPKMPSARRIPKAESGEGHQFDGSSVFRKHAETDQDACQDPPSEFFLILRPPECQSGKCPEKDVDRVDGH